MRAAGTLVVRAARSDELAEAGAVTLAAYRAVGMAVGGYADELGDTASRAAAAELLVAVESTRSDHRVLGTVTFCPADSRYRELARADEAEFRMLAVRPDAQGRGIGRALAEACVDRARAQGFRALVLSTPAGAAVPHRLYESMGFVREPARDWSPVPGVDLIAYSLALD
ncbi:MAG: GNAT family N-acetyltransferase [Jiangellaceae bacterium]